MAVFYSTPNIMKYFSLIFVFLCFYVQSAQAQTTETKPYVVIISWDAFRWDYPEIYNTPNLNKIAEKGVKAEKVISCFPTLTFPNHYSMATGLYPNNHGVVHNKFYAEDLDKEFRAGSQETIDEIGFWGGEPIWVTAETQGVNSASFFWVGSETNISSIRPDFWKAYDHYFPFAPRTDTIIHWLSLPEEIRPHLIMWYFHEPDEVSHHYGTHSEQTKNTVQLLDSLLGDFMNKLAQLPIANEVNVIITADHGMTNISQERSVCIDDYIDASQTSHIYTAPTTFVYSKSGYRDTLYNALQKMPHARVYKREELPPRYHYGNNSRIADLVVIADCGWTILREGEKVTLSAAHGYDNACDDMAMIFYAYGPAFNLNYTQPIMENVDIYNIITNILNLTPAKNDGNFERVREMLKPID